MLNKKYNRVSTVVPTYDYIDSSEGVGYVIYYGYQQKTSGATAYKLSRNKIYSYNVETSGASGTGETEVVNANFDLPIEKPKDIEGTFRFVVPYQVDDEGGSPNGYFHITVSRYDGSTTTNLGIVDTTTITAGQAPQVHNPSVAVAKTHFNTGDTLRVNVKMICWSNPAVGHIFAHSPYDEDCGFMTVGTNISTTRFEVHVPYSIQ